MVKFFAVNASTGRVERFYSEAMRDDFVNHGYGHAISRADAENIMRAYVLNYAAGIASGLLRETARITMAQNAQATERLYYYYENADQLIVDYVNLAWT